MADPGTITRVLNGPRDPADPEAAAVFRRLYREMRTIALKQLRGQRRPGLDQLDLGATVLVHEAWLKLERTGQWDGRAHFFGSAARAMRQVLSRESQRRRGRGRRESVHRERADRTGEAYPPASEALLERAGDVDRAIKQIEAEDPQLADIAVMRLYGGMSAALIAEELGVSKKKVERRWKYAAVRLRSLIDRDRTRH